MPEAELLVTGETGGDPRSYRVDFTKIEKMLPEFRAEWSVADGAAELLREYRARGLTQEAFDKRFTRLAVLAARQAAGTLDATLRPPDPWRAPSPIAASKSHFRGGRGGRPGARGRSAPRSTVTSTGQAIARSGSS